MDLIDTSYPLHWPEGWPRRPYHRIGRAKFDRQRTLAEARDFVLAELRRLGAGSRVVISSNVRLRRDGLPLSGQAQPQDKGVAVYFALEGRDQVLACDLWDRVEDNLYAVAKHIEAVRAQARYGVGTVEQAFRGYQALPPPKSWWQVLGVSPEASVEAINEAFRAAALRVHPDRSGTSADMAQLTAARDEGRRARGR